MTEYFEPLFKGLIENAYRDDVQDNSVDLVLASFTALSTLAENSCENSYVVLFNYLVPVLFEIEKTMSNDFKPGSTKARAY